MGELVFAVHSYTKDLGWCRFTIKSQKIQMKLNTLIFFVHDSNSHNTRQQ